MILRLRTGWLLRGPAAGWPPFARQHPAVDWAADSSAGRPRGWNSASVGSRVVRWTQWCAHGKGAPLLGRHPAAMSYSDGSLTAAWPTGIQSIHCSRRAARGTPSLEGGSTVRGSAHACRDYRGSGCADRWNPHRCSMTWEAVAHLEDDDRFGGCAAVGSPTCEWASTERGTGYSVFHRGLLLGFVSASGTPASRPAAHCQQGAYGSGHPDVQSDLLVGVPGVGPADRGQVVAPLQRSSSGQSRVRRRRSRSTVMERPHVLARCPSGHSTHWLAAAVGPPTAAPCRREGRPPVGRPQIARGVDHACSGSAQVVFQLDGLCCAGPPMNSGVRNAVGALRAVPRRDVRPIQRHTPGIFISATL